VKSHPVDNSGRSSREFSQVKCHPVESSVRLKSHPVESSVRLKVIK